MDVSIGETLKIYIDMDVTTHTIKRVIKYDPV